MRYGPCRAWKWNMVTFEVAMTFELVSVVAYWSLIHDDVWRPNSKLLSKMTLVLDHFLPLLLLLIDYLFLSNPVFLRRHAYVVASLLLLYLPINMYFSVAGKPPYSMIDW